MKAENPAVVRTAVGVRPAAAAARWLGAAIVLVLGSALPIAAVPTNLVSNGGFDDDLASWSATPGWAHTAADGVFGLLGAAELVSSGAGFHTLSQCLPTAVAAGRSLTAVVFARTVNHSTLVAVRVEAFVDGACSTTTGAAVADGTPTPPVDAWAGYYVPLPMPAGTGSVRVTLEATTTAAGQITRFDGAQLRYDLIVNGSFTNNLGSWTQTPPGSWSMSTDGVSAPAGSAEAVVSGDGSVFLAQCLPLADVPTTPRFAGWVRVKALDELADYQLSYQFWDHVNCAPPGNFLGAQGLLTRPGDVGEWQFFSTNVDVPIGAQAVVVIVALNAGGGTPGTRFRVDDLILTASNVIFWDGFETGDAAAWSAQVP